MPEIITEIKCVICNKTVYHNYKLKNVQDDLESRWYHCPCGCVFNLYKPDVSRVFTEEYRKQYEDLKEAELRYLHYVRCYVPLIEEKIYGRKFLDVGFGTDYIIKEMRRRGWLATGIDLIKHPNNYICADFMKYSFSDEKFDFIMMCDFLQCVDEPMEALRRVYNLLYPEGILFIVTPNTDLIRDGKIGDWGPWDMETNRQFFSEELLTRMISKLGADGDYMKIIYKDNNISNRFLTWNNLHLLLQKLAY